MVDPRANIDVVFRNGLKDFEVLPPAEVWERIHPVIKNRNRPYAFMSAAAMISVVLTMSILAYQWNRQISDGTDSETLALYDQSFYPVNGAEILKPQAITRTNISTPVISGNEVVEIQEDQNTMSGYETMALADIQVPQEADGFLFDNVVLSNGPKIFDEGSADESNIEIGQYQNYSLPVEETGKNIERWSIAALASPTYYSSFNSGSDELSRQLKASEQNMVSYTGGVSFAYRLNKRFTIQSGLFFSSIGQELDGVSSFGGFQQYNEAKGNRNFEVLTSNGIVYTNNPDVFLIANGPAERITSNISNDVFDPKKASLQYINDNLLQNFSYLELPVYLRYKFLDKTIDFNLIGGISYNILVNNSVYTMVDGGKYLIGKTEGLNMITLSSSIGMGMEYSFSEKLSLNLEPTFRYYHNPFGQTSSSGTHPYSFGIFSGLSYRF